jgi:hypothetical protein
MRVELNEICHFDRNNLESSPILFYDGFKSVQTGGGVRFCGTLLQILP